MKYGCELLINKPRREVWQAFEDPQKVKLWQPSLIDVELISGTKGQPGFCARLTFREREREFSLTETITDCREPEKLDQLFENQFANNTVKNTFLERGPVQTLWRTETEYKFKTLLMKIMGPLYRKNFLARTEKDMNCFKEMLESS